MSNWCPVVTLSHVFLSFPRYRIQRVVCRKSHFSVFGAPFGDNLVGFSPWRLHCLLKYPAASWLSVANRQVSAAARMSECVLIAVASLASRKQTQRHGERSTGQCSFVSKPIYLFLTSAKEVMFSSLFVCLLATLRKNFRTDLHEIFREGWQWANEQTIKFWWRSGSPSGYRYCFPDSSLFGATESG